jgi:hypothetical protein
MIVTTRCFPSIDPPSMTILLTATLEMEDTLENVVDKTERSPGRGPSFSTWLTLLPDPS